MLVERIEVEEGFLDGLSLEFVPGLNVLIGPRGTGKTSIIELIRFCLDVHAFTAEAREAALKHALAVLGTGRVTLTLLVDGQRVSVSRAAMDEGPRSSSDVALRPVSILSQKEIERIGLDGAGRLRLLDEFAPQSAEESLEEGAYLARLRSLSTELRTLAVDIAATESSLAEVKKLQIELDAARLEEEEILGSLAEHQSEQDELRELNAAIDELAVRETLFESASSDLREWQARTDALIASSPRLPAWPESAGGQDLLALPREHVEQATAMLNRARQSCKAAAAAVEEQHRSVREAHAQLADRALVSELERVAAEVVELAAVEISTAGEDLGLTQEQDRLLRIITRRFGGTTGRIRPLTGGLSSSKTLEISVIDAYGATAAQCVVKVGSRTEVEEELRRYEDNIPATLTAMGFAPVAGIFRNGVANTIAVAYTIAGADLRSLGAVVEASEADAMDVVTRLRAKAEPWIEGAHAEQQTVSDLCELLSAPNVEDSLALPDPVLGKLVSLQVQVRIGRQHGDLHVGNVLVNSIGEPILIDYGRTGLRVMSYDPVTLELCLAFHPDARSLSPDWPSVEQATRFDQLDEYLAGCTVPEFVRRCRAWAHEVANGDREVWVAVLAYSLRQLGFDDTDHDLARAYAHRAAELLAAS